MESTSSAIFTIDGQPHLSLPEAAHRLRVPYQDLKHWVASGKILSARLDGRWFVGLSEVERLERDGPPAKRKRGPKSREQHLQQLAQARTKIPRRPWTPERAAQLQAAREKALAAKRLS